MWMRRWINFCAANHPADVKELLILGLNHEEQHQELLYTDIKYILGHNPLFPAYSKDYISPKANDDNCEIYKN